MCWFLSVIRRGRGGCGFQFLSNLEHQIGALFIATKHTHYCPPHKEWSAHRGAIQMSLSSETRCSSVVPRQREPLASVSLRWPPMPVLHSSQNPLERSMKLEKRKLRREDQRRHCGLISNKRASEGAGTRRSITKTPGEMQEKGRLGR